MSKRLLTLTVNHRLHEVAAPDHALLIEVLRETLSLTGTKQGCDGGECGACTVLVDGQATRSCQLALGDVTGPVTTIEGLGPDLHPLQQAWIAHQVAQCGYCQSGQIMQAAALLAENPKPTDAEILDAMDGNLCRCGTYPRILAAIRTASAAMEG